MTTLNHRTPTVIEGELVDTSPLPALPALPAPGRNPHAFSAMAGGACTGIGLAGLVTTAVTSPDAVMWPIGATLAAAALASIALLRQRWWDADNAGVCEFVRSHNPA